MSDWVLSLPWAVLLAGLVIAWTPRIVFAQQAPAAPGTTVGTVIGLLINLTILSLAIAALVR